MVALIRDYVIPLRRETKKAPKWRRSKKAISVIRRFIKKHMKTEKVIICNELNEKIWERGIKNPPGKVAVTVANIEKDNEVFSIVNLKEIGIEKYIVEYERDKVKEKVEKLKEESNKKEQEEEPEREKEAKKTEVKESKESDKNEQKEKTNEKKEIKKTKENSNENEEKKKNDKEKEVKKEKKNKDSESNKEVKKDE